MSIGSRARAAYRKTNKKYNPYLAPDTVHDSAWEEQANCSGKAYELFEYQDRDSPLAKGMSFKDRIAFNRTNFELAAEICIECPVMFQCLESASVDEKYWTVRGGEMPARFGEESTRYANVGRPVGSKNKLPSRTTTGRFHAEPGDRECSKGHIVPGGGRCLTCKHENNVILQRKYRAAARQKKKDQVV